MSFHSSLTLAYVRSAFPNGLLASLHLSLASSKEHLAFLNEVAAFLNIRAAFPNKPPGSIGQSGYGETQHHHRHDDGYGKNRSDSSHRCLLPLPQPLVGYS
jgi:hypothetical protein